MRLEFFVSLLAILALLAPGAFAQQPNDIQTSFEFQDSDGRFIIGDCPGCAVFAGGVAAAAPNPQLAVNGSNAWLVAPGSTALITFEIPARNLTFLFKDETAAVQSVVTLRDVNGTVLQTVNGSTSGPETNGFTKVEVTGSSAKTVTVKHNSTTPTPAAVVALENLIASFNPTPALVVVDSFFFPRFADGTFGSDPTNTFITEAFLTNDGNYAEVRMSAFNDQGQPVNVMLEDQETQNGTTDSSFRYELQPGASVAVRTIGLGDGSLSRRLISGYLRVEVRRLEGQQPANGGRVEGTAVFSRLQGDQVNQVLLFETGVPATRELANFTLFLDSVGEKDTGLALVNPPSSTSTTPNRVNVTVWDQRFEQRTASASFDLAPGQAVSKFIWEYIQEFGQNILPDVIAALQNGRGVVQVTSTGTAPLVLRQNNPFGVFPETVPTLTSFPVIARQAPAE